LAGFEVITYGRFSGDRRGQTNAITRDASVALFASGLFDSRENDRFGTGFYYNGISDPVKQDIAQLTGNKTAVQNEKG
jgi:hypothetical protein